MSFWVYMLQCADGRYYTGHTDDLERRLVEHIEGGYCRFTSTRRPLKLVWNEYFSTRLEALEAERQIGRWSRAKKQALIRGDWPSLSLLARPPGERFSTSLETNGSAAAGTMALAPDTTPFVSSELETPVPKHPGGER